MRKTNVYNNSMDFFISISGSYGIAAVKQIHLYMGNPYETAAVKQTGLYRICGCFDA